MFSWYTAMPIRFVWWLLLCYIGREMGSFIRDRVATKPNIILMYVQSESLWEMLTSLWPWAELGHFLQSKCQDTASLRGRFLVRHFGFWRKLIFTHENTAPT